MAAYRFLTNWLLEAPREEIWDADDEVKRAGGEGLARHLG